MPNTNGRRYTLQLLSVAAICWIFAWAIAGVMHRIQHAQWGEAYRLVPVNRASLYFFPLASGAVLWLARRVGRFNSVLFTGTVLVWLWVVGRVVFWTSIASGVGHFPAAEEFGAIMANHLVSSSLVGVVGLAAMLVLALGVIASIRSQAPRVRAPLVLPPDRPEKP